ncbi:hypothetical protein Tco_0561508 [Tanacetum coccineum]
MTARMHQKEHFDRDLKTTMSFSKSRYLETKCKARENVNKREPLMLGWLSQKAVEVNTTQAEKQISVHDEEPFAEIGSSQIADANFSGENKQEMSEDRDSHSSDVLASIKSQVPTVVENIKEQNLKKLSIRILERDSAEFNQEISAEAWPRAHQ